MSRKQLSVIVIPAIALALCAPSAAQADFVTNGSFEANTLAAGTKLRFNTNNVSAVSGWSGGTGLTYLAASGSADNGSTLSVYGPFPKTSPDGGNFIEADGAQSFRGVFYQTVSGLTVGQTYAVSFYQAAGQQKGRTGITTEQWQVGLGTTLNLSTSIGHYQDSSMFTLPQGGVGAWQAQTMNFTATATSEVLSFLAIGTPNGQPPICFLDGVTMNAVPEPASLVLMGVGMIGFGVIRRCRRAKTAVV